MAQSPFAPNTIAHRVAWLALPILAACAGSTAPPSPPALTARPKPQCEVAARLRAIVPRLQNEGKLHRTGRVIEKANRLCAASAAETWAAELSVSIALSRYAEARTLVATIEASPVAPEEARTAARAAAARLSRFDKAWPPAEKITPDVRRAHEAADRAAAEGKREEAIVLYEKAWEAWSRDGRALMSAGLLAKQLGRTADAQRFFDRATALLEAASGSAVTAEVPKAVEVAKEPPPAPSGVVWSPDGKAVAVARGDAVSVLDIASWRPQRRLGGQGHDSIVVGAAFSPDGKRITAVSNDAMVRVWDAQSGAPIRDHRAPGGDVNAAAFSPHGERIALGAADGTVRLWDAVSGAVVRTLKPVEADAGGVSSVAISPDGDSIASGADEPRVVRVWDAKTGALRFKVTEPGRMLCSVLFSPDGKHVTAGSIVWDAKTGAPLHRLEEYDSQGCSPVAFSPDGKRIAGESVEELEGAHTVMLWDGPTGDPLRVLPGLTQAVTALSFSPDGKLLATAEWDGKLRLWDVETGMPLRVRGGRVPQVRELAISPAKKRVASGFADGTVQLWQADTGASHQIFRGHPGWVQPIALSPDGERLASTEGKAGLRLWDAGTGAPLFTLEGHAYVVNAVTFSPDGERLASAAIDNTVRLWNARTGAPLATLRRNGGAASVAFSPDGERLAASSGNTLTLWQVATGALLATRKDAPKILGGVAFSPSGKSLASVASNAVRVLDSVEGPPRLILGASADLVKDVVFSPDGKSVASAVSDGTVQLWDAETGAALATLRGHESPVLAMAFSPASPILWSGSRDGEIRLWRLPSGSPMATLGVIAGKSAAYHASAAGPIDFVGADPCAARELAVCRIGPHVFPFDVCEERFYSPGLLGRILSGDPVSLDLDRDLDPENEPALLSCPRVPAAALPAFAAPPIPQRKVCRPLVLPNPKGVLSPGDLEEPYRTHDRPQSLDLEQMAKSAPFWGPIVLGFDAKLGRGAAIMMNQMATAGEGCPQDVRGEIFDLRTGRILSSEAFGRGSCAALEQASARHAAALTKRGFSPAKDLVARVTERYAGNDGFAPLAVLDSPLCGWMIHVKSSLAQRRFSIALVSPANDKRHELGSVPFGDACIVYDEHARCAIRGEFSHPIVHHVALTPDRSRLSVLIGATRGAHNDPVRFHRGLYVLPRGILPPQSPVSRGGSASKLPASTRPTR